MELYELAFACYVYGRKSNYDKSYCAFLKATNHELDIENDNHRTALLEWLTKWGCRQFSKKHRDLASKQIKAWYEQFSSSLFPVHKDLLELTKDEGQVLLAGKAYAALSERKASKRKTKNGGMSNVLIGPTGAAKILFALRPNTFPPWDGPIRHELNLNGTAESYVSYLGTVGQKMKELGRACERNDYRLSDLPKLVDRPSSSLVKLIDEYFWVTISSEIQPPARDTLARWVTWH